MECRPSQKKDKADVKANPFTTFNIYGGELKPLSVTFSGNSSNSESYFERDPQTIAPPQQQHRFFLQIVHLGQRVEFPWLWTDAAPVL